MQIQGRSLGQAAQELVDRLNALLNRTVTQKRLSLVLPRHANEAQISFREHGVISPATLVTAYGRMDFDLRQVCDAVPGDESGMLVLRTRAYRYTIRPEGAEEPLLRWEYVRFPADEDATWNRHHIQGPVALGIRDRNGVEATLNSWHTPTGAITVEDVLRFCITDLGVRPLHSDWHHLLRETANAN